MSVPRPVASTIPDLPGAYLFRDGDGRVIYVGKARSLRKRLANYGHDSAQVLAGGEFWDHTAIGLVGGDLGGDHVGDELLARAYDGGGGFVAGSLDAEDVGVGHVRSVKYNSSRPRGRAGFRPQRAVVGK